MHNKYTALYEQHYKKNGTSGSGTGEYKIKEKLWEDVGYQSGMSVLDYGCGWGAMIPAVKDLDLYLGVDISPTAIQIGTAKFPNAHLEEMEMGSLKTEEFDFVVAMSVFTHIPHDYQSMCVKDLYQGMKDDGFGLLDILDGPKRLVRGYIAWTPLTDFQKLLKDEGFDSEFVTTIQWPGYKHTYLKIWKA